MFHALRDKLRGGFIVLNAPGAAVAGAEADADAREPGQVAADLNRRVLQLYGELSRIVAALLRPPSPHTYIHTYTHNSACITPLRRIAPRLAFLCLALFSLASALFLLSQPVCRADFSSRATDATFFRLPATDFSRTTAMRSTTAVWRRRRSSPTTARR